VARTAQGAKTLARDAATVFDEVREIERGSGYRVYLATRK
jgi:putative component of toxin-antitoxin plasmid stabilization module